MFSTKISSGHVEIGVEKPRLSLQNSFSAENFRVDKKKSFARSTRRRSEFFSRTARIKLYIFRLLKNAQKAPLKISLENTGFCLEVHLVS